jgi:hypothetical protein
MMRELAASKVCDQISVLNLTDWNWTTMPAQGVEDSSSTMYHSTVLLLNQMVSFGGKKLKDGKLEDGMIVLFFF